MTVADPDEERRWFAVKAHPRRETVAELNLRRQKFETFLPLTAAPPQALTRRGLPRASEPTAFFPGYLFIRLSLVADRWHVVNNTYGVSRIVQLGDRPTPTPNGLIERLKAMITPEGALSFEDPFQPGDPIQMVGGPFAQAIGVFQRVAADQRVIVLLNLMQTELSVSAPRALVMGRS